MEWLTFANVNALLIAVGVGAIIVKLLDMVSGKNKKRLKAEKQERDNLRDDIAYLREEIRILKSDVRELRLHLAESEGNVKELSSTLCKIDIAVHSFREDDEVRQEVKNILEDIDLSKFK